MGALVGFAGAKARWSRWLVHLVGAGFAAIILPVFAGWVDHPGGCVDAGH